MVHLKYFQVKNVSPESVAAPTNPDHLAENVTHDYDVVTTARRSKVCKLREIQRKKGNILMFG